MTTIDIDTLTPEEIKAANAAIRKRIREMKRDAEVNRLNALTEPVEHPTPSPEDVLYANADDIEADADRREALVADIIEHLAPIADETQEERLQRKAAALRYMTSETTNDERIDKSGRYLERRIALYPQEWLEVIKRQPQQWLRDMLTNKLRWRIEHDGDGYDCYDQHGRVSMYVRVDVTVPLGRYRWSIEDFTYLIWQRSDLQSQVFPIDTPEQQALPQPTELPYPRDDDWYTNLITSLRGDTHQTPVETAPAAMAAD